MNDELQKAGTSRDPGGLVAMYTQHRDAVLRFLKARTRNPAEADDVLQELWIRLNQVHVGPISHARAYLFQMANNLVLDRERESRRRLRRDESWVRQNFDIAQGLAGEGQAIDPVSRPDQMLEEADELRLLEQAIAALPERARQVFCLHKIDGLGHAEVSARLGITRSAVEKHIAVAMKNLRRTLLDCGLEGPAASPMTDD